MLTALARSMETQETAYKERVAQGRAAERERDALATFPEASDDGRATLGLAVNKAKVSLSDQVDGELTAAEQILDSFKGTSVERTPG
ncbi:hypothetical protein [Sorangium sp. So ce117]|uniref:hypothetical protein n=1 Tax=Sorangium sp. So ce117 TaxID=3133277 RepID=UPI003F5F18F6